MRAFLDVEFCDCDKHIDLISIGLVSDTGKTFYAELANGWDPNLCNLFVQDEILPILGAPGVQRLKRKECAAALWSWLQETAGNENVEIVFDYELDGDLCKGILAEAPAGEVEVTLKMLFMCPPEADAYQDVFDEFFASNPEKVRHHALHDAEALRHAYGRLGWQA